MLAVSKMRARAGGRSSLVGRGATAHSPPVSGRGVRRVLRMQFRAFHTYIAEMGLTGAVVAEAQSGDYESGVAQIGNQVWHIRTARNTPAKPGAFVAFWRRDDVGNTRPFGDDDPAAGLLVFVEHDGNRGVFRFTIEHLAELGIAAGRRPGKRGFRLYPSWSVRLNRGATTAQRAQAPAFQPY